MKKKTLVPPHARSSRRFIDGGFICEDGLIAPDIVLTTTWWSFFNWIKWSHSGSHFWNTRPAANDDLPGDEARLLKLEEEALKRGIPRSELDTAVAELNEEYRQSREAEARHKPRFKHVAHSLIVSYREIADDNLSTLSKPELRQLRLSFCRWLQGPRSPALEEELPEDRARLKKIEKEGRARGMPSFLKQQQ
jgi:hypothetical protein